MKTSLLFHSTLLLTFLLAAALLALNGMCKDSTAQASPSAPALAAAPIPNNDAMRKAAQTFLASLSADEKARTVFPLSSDERQNMNFVPMTRKGLIFKDMTAEQRRLCLLLVQTGLSEKGYSQSVGIMANEDLLSNLEGRARGNTYRNPDYYWLAIFGEPSADEPWGWRFEGHHLSLNYTSVTGKMAVTPNFMGANPGMVLEGAEKGRRLLPEEEDLARRLVQSFGPAQRSRVVIAREAYPEIITGNARVASFATKEGLPRAEMLPAQQTLLDSLLNVYLGRMKPEVARAKWAVIEQAGLDSLYFAWAGGLQPGEGHYYRIHGKSFVIEYDNTQNRANHIHTVWREFEGDFGRDLLREHYGKAHKH